MWNSFKIAFSMYSKIPMPQSEWTDENMSLAMCFFPWVGAVIGLASWVVYQAGGWLADRQETLSSGIPGSSNLFFDDFISADSHLYYWRNSSGWFFGYTGCFKFLSADGTQTGDFKRFSCRSICNHFLQRIFFSVHGDLFYAYSSCSESNRH